MYLLNKSNKPRFEFQSASVLINSWSWLISCYVDDIDTGLKLITENDQIIKGSHYFRTKWQVVERNKSNNEMIEYEC